MQPLRIFSKMNDLGHEVTVSRKGRKQTQAAQCDLSLVKIPSAQMKSGEEMQDGVAGSSFFPCHFVFCKSSTVKCKKH
jgi:hypothetical protein